jgi:hypothetical protein
VANDNIPPEQEALLRSLAAVCNDQTEGWLVADLANVVGWFAASVAVTHGRGNPIHEAEIMKIISASMLAAFRGRLPLGDTRQ